MYRFCCAQWGYGLPAILARSWRRWENLHAQGWIFLVYGEYLPGTTRGKAAQNSAARLIGGATFHSMDGFSPGDALQNRQDGKKLLRCSRSGDARLFYWWDLSDSAKPLGRFAGSMWIMKNGAQRGLVKTSLGCAFTHLLSWSTKYCTMWKIVKS